MAQRHVVFVDRYSVAGGPQEGAGDTPKISVRCWATLVRAYTETGDRSGDVFQTQVNVDPDFDASPSQIKNALTAAITSAISAEFGATVTPQDFLFTDLAK